MSLDHYRGFRVMRLAELICSLAAAVAGATTAFAEQQVPGTKVEFKPYVEAEGGYDSNSDNLVDNTPSAFEKIEGGLTLSAKTPSEYTALTLRARELHFDDIDRENRWDFKAAFDATFDLSDTQTLKVGTNYFRDFLSLDRADIISSYGDYALRTQDFRFRAEAKSHVEINIEDGGQGDETLDVFNVSRGKAFDFSRTDGRVSLLTFTRFWLQPFVIYDYANLDYFSQVSNPLIDRNANEQFGIAGARVEFDKRFRIDVGLRLNDREFDDDVVHRFSSEYVDVNMFWQPVDALKITGIVERILDEPSTSFGLADDVRSYGSTLDWDFSPRWSLSLSGYYDRVEPIGDDLLYNKLIGTVAVTYEPNDNTELFVSTLGKWVREEETGDEYTRFKVGSGVRLKY
jgi:hypothetical protein